MTILKTIAVAAVLAVAASGTASAAGKCSQKSFAGVWLISSTAPALCLLELNSKGSITESRCYVGGNYFNPSATLTGSIKVTSACKISGTVTEQSGKKATKITLSGTATPSEIGNIVEATGKAGKTTLRIGGFQQW